MALLHRSTATLRIMGSSLVPAEISAILGIEPDYACLKGDQVFGFPLGQLETVPVGIWSLKASDQEPENLDGQVQEILNRLTPDLNVWAVLTRRFKLNLFCGLFMSEYNEGLLLSPQTLISLGQRGIELDCDLYAP